MKLIFLLFTFLLLFVNVGNTQGFIVYDTLAFNLDGYGFIEYAIPIASSYDSIIETYTDTMFVWVVVNSLPIDSVIMIEFDFIQPTKNMWVAHLKFLDSGINTIQTRHRLDTTTCTIEAYADTVIVNKIQDGVLIYIIPESAPAWIRDLTISY